MSHVLFSLKLVFVVMPTARQWLLVSGLLLQASISFSGCLLCPGKFVCACKPCCEAVFWEGCNCCSFTQWCASLVMAVTKCQGALALEGMASCRSKQPYFQCQVLGFWTSRQRQLLCAAGDILVYFFSLCFPHLGQGGMSPIFLIFIFR